MNGWRTAKLGEIIEAVSTVDPTRNPMAVFKYVDVSSVSNHTFSIEEPQALLGKDAPSRARRRIQSGDVLFATIRPTLKRVAIVPPDLDGEVCSTGYFVFRPNTFLDARFLFYFLLSPGFLQEMERIQTGASYPAVNDGQVKSQFISFPVLSEQKRIVAILDEVFEGIGKATANAERNLANARELGDSAIASALSADDEVWVTRRLEDCFRLKSGDNLTSSQMIEGAFPVYGGNGVAGSHHESNLDGDNVIVGRVGALCGNARRIIEPIWLTDNAFRVTDKDVELHNGFLTYLLNFKKLRSLARQSAQPVISNSSLRDLLLTFPSSVEQQSIISDRLDAITETVSKLEERYNHRICLLNDLKASILHKAFSGQLTRKETIAA